MTSPATFRPAALRLKKALSALQPAGLAATFALGAAPLLADTVIAPGYNAYSTESTLDLGALTRSAGGSAFFSGGGTISASATLENAILGPWSNIGTGANTRYATLSGGNVVSFTAGTAASAFGWTSGNNNTFNYDVAAVQGNLGVGRQGNTARYTGAAGTQNWGNGNTTTVTLNGLLNAGTGTLTFSEAGGTAQGQLAIGTNNGNELVLGAANAGLAINIPIINTGANAGSILVTGPNVVSITSSGGASTYTGATTVASGTLLLSGVGDINTTSGISVNGPSARYVHTSSVASTRTVTLTRGTVDGTGTLGTVNVANNTGAIVTNGNGNTGTLTIGTLSFAGAATITARPVLGGPTAINVTGTLSTTPSSGTVTINAAATGWTAGTYNLIGLGTFTGSLSDFTLGTISGMNARQSTTGLLLNGNTLAIQISGDTPKWTGAQSGAWTTDTVGGAKNWKLVNGGTPTEYLAGDEVLFDDTAAGTTTIDISTANVAPATTTFNNSSKNYTFSSSGGFGISNGTLTKNGSGTVTLATVNTYTGATTINAGTLQLGDGTTDGSIASTSVVNNGTLAINNTSAKTFAANSISGSGNLTKTGVGSLTLSGTNTYAGGTSLNGGTLSFSGTGALGTGAVVLASGATLSSTGSTLSNTVTGSGDYVSASGQGVIGGDWTGFSGTVSTTATADISYLNNATAGVFNGTSENAAYVNNYTANNTNGLIVANTSGADLTVRLGSYSSLALSNMRISNASTNVVTFEIGHLNTSTTVAGGIGGGGGSGGGTIALRKVGTGTLTIAGNGTYTAGTAVNGGALLVNGTLSAATNAVTVASGASLGGSGTIAGATTVNGQLAPGDSVGVLTLSGALTLASGSTSDFAINGLTRGSEYDGVNVAGSFTLGGTVGLHFGGSIQAGTYTLFQIAGSTAGGFAGVTANSTATSTPVSLTESSSIWTGTLDGFELSFNATTGTLTVSAPAHTALQTWRFDQFGVYDDDAGVLAGDTEDYDGDGLANLLEYALGTDPKATTANPLTLARSGNFLTLTYSRRSPEDPALTYTVEGSNNLASGFTSATGSTNTVGSTSTYTDDVDAVTAGRRFLRLSVSHTP